jgi:outer membrane protein assembly factor BamB
MKKTNCVSLFRFSSSVVLALLCTSPAAQAADWTQYRGQNHNGIATESLGISTLPKEGPPCLWKVPTPNGFSSFTIAGGKAFTLVQRTDKDGVDREVCVALDAATGKELWSATFGIAKYDGGGDSGADGNDGGDGPRSTPSLDGNHVYVYDSRLGLYCLDAGTGKVVWQKDIVKEFDGRNISWQSAASPMIDGDLLYIAGGGPGQSFIAFNKNRGEVVWKGLDEMMTHATPIPADILGVHQIIFFAQSGLVSVDAKTGSQLWQYPFPYKTSTAASPIVDGDLVYCSAGYGIGAGLCKVVKTGSGFKAEEVWRKPNALINHWSTPILKDGYLYGMFSFKNHGVGPIKCVELLTGKEKWSQEGFGPGNCILAGDKLVALSDKGEIALIEPTPEAYKEISRAKVVDGKCWSTPSLSNGHLYVRSTKEGVCLDVSKAK